MRQLRIQAVAAVLGYGGVYALSLARLGRAPGFDSGESLAIMLIFGIGFSAVAWLASAGAVPAAAEVRAPARETAAIVLYLAVFAIAVLGWGLGAVREAVPREPLQGLAILGVKLVTMVALPAWLFTRLGHRWGALLSIRRFDAVTWRAFAIMAVLLLGLQALVGRGLGSLAALAAPAWLVAAFAVPALLWMVLETGLAEEFLFRVLLQTRLAASLRSETAGIVVMALLFGLAHAPGYVLRGAHAMEGMATAPDPLTAAAYSIVVVSPLGLMFGVLWARTRSLLLVAALHGLADLIPNLAPFIQAWTRH